MENLTNLSVVREILNGHGFTFSKAMGQNFLVNPSVCPRIAQESGVGPGWGVLEVGPGIGALTDALCRRADKVVAVELDKRLPAILAQTLGDHRNVKIVQGDILKMDLALLLKEEFAGLRVAVCANLPYYITSPVLMKLLEERPGLETITVMVQKEAAERICAAPGTRKTGAISLAAWYYAEPKLLFNVSRGSFMPPPHVDSAVIHLQVRPAPLLQPAEEKSLFALVKAAFGQRRKTLQNALSGPLNLTKDVLLQAFEQLSHKPQVRAEELTLEEFLMLARLLAPMLTKE